MQDLINLPTKCVREKNVFENQLNQFLKFILASDKKKSNIIYFKIAYKYVIYMLCHNTQFFNLLKKTIQV